MPEEVEERAVEGQTQVWRLPVVRQVGRKFRKPVLFRFFFGASETEAVDLREGGHVEAAKVPGRDAGKVRGLVIEDLAEPDVCQLFSELELC